MEWMCRVIQSERLHSELTDVFMASESVRRPLTQKLNMRTNQTEERGGDVSHQQIADDRLTSSDAKSSPCGRRDKREGGGDFHPSSGTL